MRTHTTLIICLMYHFHTNERGTGHFANWKATDSSSESVMLVRCLCTLWKFLLFLLFKICAEGAFSNCVWYSYALQIPKVCVLYLCCWRLYTLLVDRNISEQRQQPRGGQHHHQQSCCLQRGHFFIVPLNLSPPPQHHCQGPLYCFVSRPALQVRQSGQSLV